MTQHRFSVHGTETYLDGQPFLVKGLRCSNALISDAATVQLIDNLGVFAGYGINAVGVYLMGSRFGDVKGYYADGGLSPVHALRLRYIIEAADDRGMAVLVGCLYWSNSRALWPHWTQAEAETAVRNTVRWLADHDYRNTFVDVDNEGMAQRRQGIDDRALLRAGKAAAPGVVMGTNYRGDPPPEADLALHFSHRDPGKPYIESEGSPPSGLPTPGGYWGAYSKLEGLYTYRNVGLYTEAMKESQIAATREHLESGHGYLLASTWLQANPPQGPNHCPGGYGSRPDDRGIRWWLEFVRDTYGAYEAPAAV
jgi:hypothetical protein